MHPPLTNSNPTPGISTNSPDEVLKNRIGELENQLAEKNLQLEASRKEIDSLLHYLSHDLRAPLRGIDGYSQALLEDYGQTLEPMAKAYLEYIRDSSNRLSQTIDGLLRLSRIERCDLNLGPVNLSELANSIIKNYQSNHPECVMSYQIQPNLVVQADPHLTRILIDNLLMNAIKFSSKKIRTEIEFGSFVELERQVFFIKDHGVGFNPDYRNQLFLPFQRLHSYDEFDGLGLGLAAAQRIIHRHNGRIWAESQIEKGATFFFTFPT